MAVTPNPELSGFAEVRFERIVKRLERNMNEQCVVSAKAWSMIETHSKNEDVIWCFTPHSCGGFQYPAYYCEEMGSYINSIDGGEERPTFWMQLPDNPVGGA